MEPNASRFEVGDYVKKVDGYPFWGVVVSAYQRRDGSWRYDVESWTNPGMLHIFGEKNLEKSGREEMPVVLAANDARTAVGLLWSYHHRINELLGHSPNTLPKQYAEKIEHLLEREL